MAIRIYLALAALVVGLVIAACGSDDSGDDSGAPAEHRSTSRWWTRRARPPAS